MNRTSLSRATTILAVMAMPIMALPATARAQTSPSASPPVVALPTGSAAPALPKALSEKIERHITDLGAQLGITASEQPQWQQFAQVIRDNAALMEQAVGARAGDVSKMTATGNLQSYAQLAQVHATNMQKLASAFLPLYNSFTPAQKKLADAVFENHDGAPIYLKH
jgi:glucose dehydrogenase